MKRLSSDELITALRIFNRVVSIVAKKHANYHRKKTLGEIKDFVSTNRWIMFPDAAIPSLRDGVNMPVPNVYVSFDDVIEDNKAGQVNGGIGMTFGNGGAMQWLWQLFKRKSNTAKFMTILNSLDDEWEVNIEHKIHTDYHAAVPDYETLFSFTATTVTAQEIQDTILAADNHLPHGNVVNAITIVTVRKATTIGSFDADVLQVFDLFFRVLSLR